MYSIYSGKAQTELDVTRHAESIATHQRCSSSLLRTSLHNLNKALKKAMADVTEFTTLLDAE